MPVHPEDRLLLGMVWDKGLYVDAVLPFGLRSAPKVFTALADALEWVIKREGVQKLFHYLDHFLIVAPPASRQCEEDLQKLLVTPHMSMFANNALLGGGVRVRVWIREQRKIKRRSKSLLSL